MQGVFIGFLDSLCPLLLNIFYHIPVYVYFSNSIYYYFSEPIMWHERYKNKYDKISSFNKLVKSNTS